jgi:hypothetical protein
MKYISTFEQFINEKYDLLNESLDEKQWKEKQKEIIKEIQTFGKQIASLIKKASSDKEWEKLLSVVQYFDSDMDADLLWREDYDEDDEELEDIDDENREVFATNLTYGIKEAISEVKSISLEDWNELTQEDWMDEEGMYGAYLKARRNAISKKLIKK